MDRLAGARELIDDVTEGEQLAGTLRDLARINRLLGGAELSWRALRAATANVAPGAGGTGQAGTDGARGDGGTVTLLDVGTGAADIPVQLLRRARRHGLPLSVTATDVSADVVRLARRWSTAAGAPLAVAQTGPDRLPFGDRSFDVVHASLVLHHLEPAPARALLAEMGRVSRRSVIVNDLVRARRWWLGAWLLTRLATRNRYTRHDAPLSVRRSYRPAELGDLAVEAGLHRQALLHDRLGHRYALVLSRA